MTTRPATLILLVSLDVDTQDVDADDVARAVVEWGDGVCERIAAKGVRVGGVSSVLVPVPADRVGAVLGSFAESLETPRG